MQSEKSRYQLRSLLQGKRGPVMCLAAHPLGTYVASGGEDGTKIWDLQKAALICSPAGAGQCGTTTAMTWIIQPDDTEEGLAFGTDDSYLCIWKREKPNEFIEIHCSRLVGGNICQEISGIAYDASSGQLAVAQCAESVHHFIIDPSMKLVVVKSMKIPQHWPQAITFGQMGGVAVYRLSTTDRLKTFDVPFAMRRIRNVAFHDGNRAIVTRSDHGKVYIFDWRSGDIIDIIDIGVKDWVQPIVTVEKAGIPLVIFGRLGANIGKTDIQIWEKIDRPSKDANGRITFQESALAIMCLLSTMFLLENVLKVPVTEYVFQWLNLAIEQTEPYLAGKDKDIIHNTTIYL
ncbi:WD40-repeat-containing domain protein [Lentinula aciculospora]|uniref:WD40-repeat-containing domain protein n=1 Tax=Lentinula aciculospora TaxID=153920 RepID=A0A9W9A6G1_9AGAR|nr:WD40-repeat-containing domain protein [Lentinula aciculospora]